VKDGLYFTSGRDAQRDARGKSGPSLEIGGEIDATDLIAALEI